jgi:hypothetical protein
VLHLAPRSLPIVDQMIRSFKAPATELLQLPGSAPKIIPTLPQLPANQITAATNTTSATTTIPVTQGNPLQQIPSTKYSFKNGINKTLEVISVNVISIPGGFKQSMTLYVTRTEIRLLATSSRTFWTRQSVASGFFTK